MMPVRADMTTGQVNGRRSQNATAELTIAVQDIQTRLVLPSASTANLSANRAIVSAKDPTAKAAT